MQLFFTGLVVQPVIHRTDVLIVKGHGVHNPYPSDAKDWETDGQYHPQRHFGPLRKLLFLSVLFDQPRNILSVSRKNIHLQVTVLCMVTPGFIFLKITLGKFFLGLSF